MAREKAPAFQWYPKDFLADGPCAAMSCAEVGAYARLLSFCWLEHSLPADDRRLARMAGATVREWESVKAAVLERFETGEDGRLRHGRLDVERKAQAEWREKSSNGGRTTQAKRNHTSTKPQPMGQPNVNTPSPSSSASPEREEDPHTPVDPTADFRAAWDAHPHTPKVQEWTEPRCAAIRRALGAKRDVMRLFAAFDRSGFLCGTRPRGEGHESFRATVDWCLKPANLVKILEGAYADPEPGLRAVPTSRPLRPPTSADAYGWCDHEPRCGTRAGHDLKLAREAREEQSA
jgi:uncharacterized protein YdaU (DUF1376 family)